MLPLFGPPSDPSTVRTYTISKTAYNGDGRLSTFTDALGNITTFIYDTANNIQTKIEPLDPTTNANPTVVTFYDSRCNVTQTTNEIGAISKITYDTNNNPLTQIDSLGNTTTYTYDSKGNQLTKKDPREILPQMLTIRITT